ncbi:MAG: CinA family protein [Hyphomicrobium sp.]
MSMLFPDDLLRDAEALLSELQRRSLMLATAESCTGGLICGLLTEVPGASAVLERGVVTYSNAAKTELLGIDTGLITRRGAVSEEVARAMAEGALAHAPVDVAVSVTGIAGPDGGSVEKPVGLVYVAVARAGSATLCHEYRFGNLNRRAIRLAGVREALAMVRAVLAEGPPAPPKA